MQVIPGIGVRVPLGVTDTVKRRERFQLIDVAYVSLALIHVGGKQAVAEGGHGQKSRANDDG
jgi:hypothetical protein